MVKPACPQLIDDRGQGPGPRVGARVNEEDDANVCIVDFFFGFLNRQGNSYEDYH